MSFSIEQRMFTLSWIAYTGTLLVAGAEGNAAALLSGVNAQLAGTEPVKGAWDVVWGPASFRIPGAIVDDMMLYVVKSTDPRTPSWFVVVIRGTNPASLSTWLCFNLMVTDTVDWPFGNAKGIPGPVISKGTHDGLTTLLGLVPAAESPGAGKPLLQFLSDAGAQKVTVTGHSLGGVLASTLGLALVDLRTRGAAGFRPWNPAGNAQIEVYSFGAPTAGNRAFAETTEQVLGSSLHRLYNPLDVVPHAWTSDTMQEVPDMFGHLDPRFFDPLFAASWMFLASHSKRVGYTHPRGVSTKLPGSVSPDWLGFLPQAIYQHGQAYIDALGLQDILQVSDVLTLPDPERRDQPQPPARREEAPAAHPHRHRSNGRAERDAPRQRRRRLP